MILKSVQSFGFFKRRYANGQTEKSEQDCECRNEERFQGGIRGTLGEIPSSNSTVWQLDSSTGLEWFILEHEVALERKGKTRMDCHRAICCENFSLEAGHRERTMLSNWFRKKSMLGVRHHITQ